MSLKNKIITIILFVLCLNIVSAVGTVTSYKETTGDALFVRGVNFEKVNNDTYLVYLKVDLAYKDYANPLNRYQSVIQYHWNNWWSPKIDWTGLDGVIGGYYNPNGSDEIYNLNLLNYYYEIPDVDGSGCKDYEMINGVRVPCTQIDYTRAGYYGLPFYIQQVEFICDVNDRTKGYKLFIPPTDYKDTFDLTRPSYQGISGPDVYVGINNTIPQGFVVFGQMVRTPGNFYETCKRMNTTANSQFNILLRPNRVYRHTNPLTTGSDTWSYSDIISLGTSLNNNNDLKLNMNIAFNYSGNWWNTNYTNQEASDQAGLIANNSGLDNMDCHIDFSALANWIYNENSWKTFFKSILNNLVTLAPFSELPSLRSLEGIKANLKYSELPTDMKLIINSGEGITCNYAGSGTITDLNTNLDGGPEFNEVCAVGSQREIVNQLDTLDKKMEIKRFITKTIIPFIAMIIVLFFYLFEIAVIGFACFSLVPIMFKQFLKGVKDSFDLSELKRVKK